MTYTLSEQLFQEQASKKPFRNLTMTELVSLELPHLDYAIQCLQANGLSIGTLVEIRNNLHFILNRDVARWQK